MVPKLQHLEVLVPKFHLWNLRKFEESLSLLQMGSSRLSFSTHQQKYRFIETLISIGFSTYEQKNELVLTLNIEV